MHSESPAKPLPRFTRVLSSSRGNLADRLWNELLQNPYTIRALGRGGERLRRRAMPAIATAGLGAFCLLAWEQWSPTGFWGALDLYILVRVFLLYRPARLAVRVARRDLRSENLMHLALSSMNARELTAGWAISGWSLALPETLAVFTVLSPLAMTLGPAAVIALGIDFLHVLLLQALAAVVASGLICGYHHRHEAATAGCLSAGFSFPLVFLAQTLVVAAIGLVLPLALLLLLGASSPALWPELDAPFFISSALFFFAVAYAAWIPVAVLQEIDRQLNIADRRGAAGLRWYLDSLPSQNV